MAILIKHVRSVVLVVGVAGLGLAGCKSSLETRFTGEKVTMEQVPDPVKQVIAQQSQGGTVGVIKKKTKGEKTFYYASLIGGNEERRLTIDQDGKVIAAESGDDGDDDD